ncbi:NAD-dependent epimerase/dehydratase family protein [Antribacter sp. KLBMP9083]|uniref:NAD-dependent epimerase/dehydratase family protein n=1 Tax=Antribacter soli TaxID=2910976 RepID=A0AA41QG72_9MICO|nr:NAD-dependent epimerase/dehydratase family protein [Antribacter soli]MCF4122528.1 NAD-dependent epimerase/dehydratase family protein [Antribacter soli]
MSKHVVVGAGQVGAHVALRLAEQGHEVVLVSRSGSGPDHPGVRRERADASDGAAVAALARDADTLYNCVNPAYHRWLTDWPPVAAGLLGAAQTTGAGYVILGNLYVYGPPSGPMGEDHAIAPSSAKAAVRARLWEEALAAHEAGRVRVTELRPSDYFGPGCRDQSHLGDRFVPPLLAGRPTRLAGDPDQPHSWSYVPDVAAALVAAGTGDDAWGRAWHIPTGPAVTYRAMAERLCEIAGAPTPRVGSIPGWLVELGGLASPMMRELRHVRYQFDRPFVLDSARSEAALGLTPTPLDDALAATIAWWRDRL